MNERVAATGPKARALARGIVRGQGAYYVATGIWPLAHLRSFLAVTGDKRERWLVQTFGLLTAAVGASLVANGSERDVGRLGWSSALAIAIPELTLSVRGRLPLPYLADGLLQLGFAGAAFVAERTAEGPGDDDRPDERAGSMAERMRMTVSFDRNEGRWALEGAGADGETYERRREAVKRGAQLGRENANAQLIIKGRDGKIREERTYGNDPRRTKG
jgi:hypothetical protein